MAKTGMKELAAALAGRRGVKLTDAGRFVEAVFDVLNDGLRDDKLVKVKGLGTFKVITVSARKSVDVNTGEAIEIAGRDKITFTPDATLRDLVNRPFAQFETVVVNDGVDFTEIDERANEAIVEEISMDEDEHMEKETVPGAERMPENREEQAMGEQPLVTEPEPIAPESEPETESDVVELIPEPESTPVQEPVLPEPKSELPPLGEDRGKTFSCHQEKQPDLSVTWEEDRYKAQNEMLTQANEMLHEQLEHSRTLIKILALVLALLVLLCCFGTFYMGRQFAQRDNRILYLEAQMGLGEQVVSEGEQAQKQEASKRQASQAKAQSASLVKKAKEKVTPSTTPAPKSEVALTPAKSAAPIGNGAYDADPRVRTGAYIIIGVDKIVIVKAGQTLSGISRSHLGPGMECYVEAINGIKEVKEGQKIKIPKLRIKKK